MDDKGIVYKKLYTFKFSNFDKMDQFFERHELPKLTQEEIDYLNNIEM